MTDAELRLWYTLRRHGLNGYKFRRQHPVGPYILDFYCPQQDSSSKSTVANTSNLLWLHETLHGRDTLSEQGSAC
jgi:hypothetical protein